MIVPQFVLVGVPKAGTTSLYHHLRAHPQVAVSSLPEINFLSYPGTDAAKEEVPWLQFSVTEFDHYCSLFADAGDRVPVDLTASCFMSDVSIERIQQFVPNSKLFVLLRDPVERAYSAYLHRVRKGYERRSVEETLVPGDRAVEIGFYGRRLSRFRDTFGAERVRVWLLEDLRARPGETMAEIFEYLGVDPSVSVGAKTIYNRGSAPRSRFVHRLFPDHKTRRKLQRHLPGSVQRIGRWAWNRNQAPPPPLQRPVDVRLRELYRDDIRCLEGMLDRDLSSWLKTG